MARLILGLMGLTIVACGRTPATGPRPGPNTGSQTPVKNGKKKETPSERSFRLFLRFVPRGDKAIPGTHEPKAPLLELSKDLDFRAQWVLIKPGERRRPTETELQEIRALGQSLDEVAYRNLNRILRDADLKGFRGQGEHPYRFLVLDTAPPGSLGLLLLPTLWKTCRKQLGPDIYVGIPAREHCSILEAENDAVLGAAAPELLHWHENGARPISGAFLKEVKGRLEKGPSFAEFSR